MYFTPVHYGDGLFVDGGYLRNYPVMVYDGKIVKAYTVKNIISANSWNFPAKISEVSFKSAEHSVYLTEISILIETSVIIIILCFYNFIQENKLRILTLLPEYFVK